MSAVEFQSKQELASLLVETESTDCEPAKTADRTVMMAALVCCIIVLFVQITSPSRPDVRYQTVSVSLEE